jgi:PQ loop repeat
MSDPQDITLQIKAHPSLFALSWFCGVTYTFLFVFGMLIQNFVNLKNESTKGYSTDYAIVAFAGFVCLLVN